MKCSIGFHGARAAPGVREAGDVGLCVVLVGHVATKAFLTDPGLSPGGGGALREPKK